MGPLVSITEKRGSGSAARWSFVKRVPRDGENVIAGGEKIGQQSRDAFIRRGVWDSCLGTREIGEGLGFEKVPHRPPNNAHTRMRILL
jgi:hypothetical protein